MQSLSMTGISYCSNDLDGLAKPAEVAAVWVDKARKGSTQWVETCSKTQLDTYRLRKRLKPIFTVVMFGYLGLAFIEQPTWCGSDDATCDDMREEVYVSGTPSLPFHLTNVLEIICYLVFMFRAWLRYKSLGDGNQAGAWNLLGHMLGSIALLDCVVAIFYREGVMFWNTFRLARLCRPLLFLASHKRLRQCAARVARAVPRFCNVLLSLAVCLFLFVWSGVILFERTEQGDKFDSWNEAVGNMWVLYTTSNNPDVWIDGYSHNRWVFFFFFVYLTLTLYLLNNVLLAAVYDSYKQQLLSSISNFYEQRREAIQRAFSLLMDDTGGVSRRNWTPFFTLYCHLRFGSPVAAAFNTERSNLVFNALDESRSGFIEFDEFSLVIDVIHDSDIFIPRKKRTAKATRGCLRCLRNLMMDGVKVGPLTLRWESLIDAVIMVDLAMTFKQTLEFIEKHQDLEMDNLISLRHGSWHPLTATFVYFYAVEKSLVIYIMGFEAFWNQKKVKTRLDFFTVYILCFLIVSFSIMKSPPYSLVRVAVLLHISRVFRVLYHIKQLRDLATIMVRLAPTYWRQVLLLITVFYIYCTLGEQLFGGLVRKRGPLHEALKGTEFAEKNYFALNFNDFFSGMVLLFVLMVLNNWTIIANAFSLLSGSTWTYAYFVSFYILVNLILMNILMSLILECFAALRSGVEEEDREFKRQRSGYTREAVLRRLFQQMDADREVHDRQRRSLHDRARRVSNSHLSAGSGNPSGNPSMASGQQSFLQ